MRLLAVTIAAALALTACAPDPSGVAPGAGSQGVIDPAPAASGAGPSAGAGSGWISWGPGPDSGRPGPTSAPSPVDSRCPAGLSESGQHDNSQAKPAPSGIEVDWVLRCTVVGMGGDQSRSLLIERSDSDPAALLAALRAPDEPRSSGPCPAIAMVVPYFALVQRDGKPLVARMPLTACGLPQTAAMQALDRMRFELIAKKALP